MPGTPSTTAPRRPAAAKAPTDRRPTAEQLRAEALAERPAGAELLRAPQDLRARDRAKILNLATKLNQDATSVESGLDEDASQQDQLAAVEVGLELVATIDETLEAEFAINAEEYAKWGTVGGGGPKPDERIVELFTWYAAALGE